MLTIADDAPNSPQSANVSGIGLSQFVTFSPQPCNFPHPRSGRREPGHVHAQQPGQRRPAGDSRRGVHEGVRQRGRVQSQCRYLLGHHRGRQRQLHLRRHLHGHRRWKSVRSRINVTDSAADSPQTLTLTGSGKSPAAFTNVRGAVGCTTATLQWTVPAGVAGSWIVRNSNHVPVNQHDGTRVRATGHGRAAGEGAQAVPHLPLRDLGAVQVRRLQAGGVLRRPSASTSRPAASARRSEAPT